MMNNNGGLTFTKGSKEVRFEHANTEIKALRISEPFTSIDGSSFYAQKGFLHEADIKIFITNKPDEFDNLLILSNMLFSINDYNPLALSFDAGGSFEFTTLNSSFRHTEYLADSSQIGLIVSFKLKSAIIEESIKEGW